jgi:hypothetical protein
MSILVMSQMSRITSRRKARLSYGNQPKSLLGG